MTRSKIIIGVLFSVVVLVALAWLVELRTKNTSLGNTMPMPLGTPVGLETMGAQGGLPILAPKMPEFTGISSWLNSQPLLQKELRGKVVLIDFWTYSCINCIRTLPHVTAWDEKYRDKELVIVGVHTPEFAFEKEESNVRKAMEQFHISYPVALDNDYGTWNVYGNHYWPAEYLFDAEGRLRYTHFGEGNYDVTEKNIQSLLEEAGKTGVEDMVLETTPEHHPSASTPETYLGYERIEYLGNTERFSPSVDQTFQSPTQQVFNKFYFDGSWKIEKEYAESIDQKSTISYPYQADALHMVMAAKDGKSKRAEVLLDNKPIPLSRRGEDVFEENGKTYVNISSERLYTLIDGHGTFEEHTFVIRFQEPGVEVYTFTFG